MNDDKEKNSPPDAGAKGTRNMDAPRHPDARRDMDAMLAKVAETLGMAWRPGDDPCALLTALEDASGGVPEDVQEVLARIMDAASALERELATKPHDH